MKKEIVSTKKYTFQNNTFLAQVIAYFCLLAAVGSVITGLIYAFINAYPDTINNGTGANWSLLWDHYFAYFGVQVSFIALAFFILFFFNKTYSIIQTGSFQDALVTFSIMSLVFYFTFDFKDNIEGHFGDYQANPEWGNINNLSMFWISTALTNIILPLLILAFFVAQLFGRRTYSYNKSLNHFSFTMLYPVIYILVISLQPFFGKVESIYGPDLDASTSLRSYYWILCITAAFVSSTVLIYSLDDACHPYRNKIQKQ